jgi:hypothetical protein
MEVVPKHAMKVHGEVTVQLQSFLTSALDGVSGQLHAPAAFSPQKSAAGIHWIGRWVYPGAGLGTVQKICTDLNTKRKLSF